MQIDSTAVYLPAEVAEMFRVSTSTIHNMVLDEQLPAVHFRSCRRILGADLIAFIQSQKDNQGPIDQERFIERLK